MIPVILALALSAPVFDFSDHFEYPDRADGAPAWFAESVGWEVHGGKLSCEGGRSFAILEQAPHGKGVAVEATVSISEHLGTEWAVAGVAVRRDAQNFWHLALVEAPEAKNKVHSVELTEMLDGNWLGQFAEATRLTPRAGDGAGFNWEYGRTYKLDIILSPEQIEGFVYDAEGKQQAHLAYAFDKRAVTTGQPALDCGNFRAAFDDVIAHVEEPISSPETAKPSYPPYTLPGNKEIMAPATGFFYPKEIDGRSWLIDPNGQAFYIVGTDHVNYHAHWCQKLGYAPYARNVGAKYGSEDKWAEAEMQRLLDWNFNTLPAGHSPSLRHRRIPHIEFMSLGTSFSDVEDLCPKTTWTGFPNVFSPKWPRHCDKMARQQCTPLKDDPWLIGYFLDNELEWFGKDYSPAGLFFEAWKKPAGHSAKQAWLAFVKKEEGSPAEFSKDWDLAIQSFDELAGNTKPVPAKTDRAREIAREWVRLVAEEYFKTCAAAIRKHDPNHLILGSRFAGDAPDVWDIAGKYCDVVSFNIYPRIDVDLGVPTSVRDQIVGWHRKAGKPMMVTEWSFPALDTDRPSIHGAGMRVDTQAQRAQCFRHFQTLMFCLPYMVGSDYFMFVDEPALGIADTFPEDSNYGLVNEQDEAYPELTAAACATNAQVYELHAKAAPPEPPKPLNLSSWLLEVPSKEVAIPDGPRKLTSGALKMEGPIGGHAWRLSRGDIRLGDFYPLMHEELAQPLWVEPDTARITGIRENDRVTVVDMELSRGQPGAAVTRVDDKGGQRDAQAVAPRRFRTGFRFRIPKEGDWLASECLWVENTDDVPWHLAEAFQYLMPVLGGTPANVEPLASGVPNYYLSGAAWVDKTVRTGVGCWYASDDAFQCSYWKDPGGGFHADLRQKVDADLKPGERRTMDNVPVFIFPFDGISRTEFSLAVNRLKAVVLEKP